VRSEHREALTHCAHQSQLSLLDQSRARTPFQNNFTLSGQECFYYSEDHHWATCLYKAQDKKDGKIKIDGNKIRFTNGASIPQEPGMNI
jgi:hypothetical protein